MLDTLRELIAQDSDYSQRTWSLEIRRRVLCGTVHDCLPYPFHKERGEDGSHIKLRDRRPSARYGLVKVVVRDSIALLFGEGRFPAIDCEDKATRELLVDLLKDTCLDPVMVDAAWRGSVGSVAVRMRVLRGRLYLDALETTL